MIGSVTTVKVFESLKMFLYKEHLLLLPKRLQTTQYLVTKGTILQITAFTLKILYNSGLAKFVN